MSVQSIINLALGGGREGQRDHVLAGFMTNSYKPDRKSTSVEKTRPGSTSGGLCVGVVIPFAPHSRYQLQSGELATRS